MRKSKNRHFYHIFISPWDAPGAITLNIIWMERKFDAYKLSRCMCPSNYYRYWDTARYLWKGRHFIIPLAFDAPVREGFPSEYRHPIWDGKTRMASLPDGKKISNISLFVLTWSTNVTDRRTLDDSNDRACIASRSNDHPPGTNQAQCRVTTLIESSALPCTTGRIYYHKQMRNRLILASVIAKTPAVVLHLQCNRLVRRCPAIEDGCRVPLGLRRVHDDWCLNFLTFTWNDAVSINVYVFNKHSRRTAL